MTWSIPRQAGLGQAGLMLMLIPFWLWLPNVKAEPQKKRELFVCSGSVKARKSVYVVPAVPGFITKVQVDIGDTVTAGQVLAELDATQAKLHFELAQAKLKVAKARFEQVKAETEKEQTPLPGKERLSLAEAEVGFSEWELRLAKRNLERLQILAPFAGTIVSRSVHTGQFVSPQPSAGITADLFQVIDKHRLAVVEVPENKVSQVVKGQLCRIEVGALPENVFQGKVERVAPIVNSVSKSFQVYVGIQVEEKGIGPHPGMSVRVRFLANE